MILGIDASRCRSGGAISHLIGILENLHPKNYNIKEIHLWSYNSLLNRIENKDWLIKHKSKALNKSLIHQLYWQRFILKRLLIYNKCDVLFTADASSLCTFKNQVVFSQDLLSYEPGIERLYGLSLFRLRLILIRWVQNKAFQKAIGVIFLSNYTSNLIQKSCGNLNNYKVIPHGVNELFFKVKKNKIISDKIVFTYVSNYDLYKNQWVVVKAIEKLNKKYNTELNLVGGGEGPAKYRLENQLKISDPKSKFVKMYDFISHKKIIEIMKNTDIFIFASSCETFGITLLEGMAAGMVIASSNKSSIPEIIEDGGLLFDPENHLSIYNTVRSLVDDADLRLKLSKKSRKLASKYSWERCSHETFNFIVESYLKYKN